MKLAWKPWLQSLLAALIGGGALLASASLSDPMHIDFKHLGVLFLSGAAIATVAYLAKSPLPPAEPVTVSVQTKTAPSDTAQTTKTEVTIQQPKA